MAATRISKTDSELGGLCEHLLNRRVHVRAHELDLDEFRRLYEMLSRMLDNRNPQASIASVGREVFVQFSEVSPQHFLIADNRPLSYRDFDFVLKKEWYGAREPAQSYPRFLVAEIRSSWWMLVIVFGLTVGFLAVARDDNLYDLLSTLLVQAATVFLSIFLIFTATQSEVLHSDEGLFEQGVLQRYYSDDKNLAILAISTVVLALFMAMTVRLSQKVDLQLAVGPWLLDRHACLAAVGALNVTMLFDTFLAVTRYYLERTRAVLERNLVAKVLDRAFKKHYRDDGDHSSRYRDSSSENLN